MIDLDPRIEGTIENAKANKTEIEGLIVLCCNGLIQVFCSLKRFIAFELKKRFV